MYNFIFHIRKNKENRNQIRKIGKIKIGFWNVIELDNEDTQFWNYNSRNLT